MQSKDFSKDFFSTDYSDECELKSYKGTGHHVTKPQLSEFKMFCLSII